MYIYVPVVKNYQSGVSSNPIKDFWVFFHWARHITLTTQYWFVQGNDSNV